ncbi:simple sugar transport system permease protein [Arthrobacter silviterrae]|uniref:ABC transporter permease n=1 Tax=Arthrobacter silviterrae TaxID=2026658 RepID=A0ABX0D8R4_9MICC|nr:MULTISPECIES: ABC transporter permease [Arthrobacter]MCU6481742.1 ABC transporter permease [Arthrobacter sp. A2-55]MDQ0279157.1 simple sugar transport system permease protein [Arthrobacter silviterrae]NGN83278.1 ABC transporter permease [Arthrobacter silviterrae]
MSVTANILPSKVVDRVAVRSWKTPILFGALALFAVVVFVLLGPSGHATFRLSQEGDAWQVPNLVLPAKVFGIIVAVVCVLLAAQSYRQMKNDGRIAKWVTMTFTVAFVIGLMVWIIGGTKTQNITLVGLFTGAMLITTPLVFGSLSGVLCERSGVINIAIEGQLLAGAFTASLVSSITHNAFAGLFAAAVAGVFVSFLLAAFSIKYVVNQIIVGVVLNVLVSGLTGFLFEKIMKIKVDGVTIYNQPAQLPDLPIPFLSEIPVIGPTLFRQSIIGYFMLILVAALWFGLFRTRWGLRIRAVGEHPMAADTVGINVNRTRFLNVLAGGAVAGIGGAYFTLVAVSSFSKDMTGGLGFIALAALIFGRWNPIGAALAALLFGVAGNLQSILSLAGTPIDGQFLAMLPYALTILAVSGFVGKSRAPAADGEPYVKG